MIYENESAALREIWVEDGGMRYLVLCDNSSEWVGGPGWGPFEAGVATARRRFSLARGRRQLPARDVAVFTSGDSAAGWVGLWD
jgi:hypothetical protein